MKCRQLLIVRHDRLRRPERQRTALSSKAIMMEECQYPAFARKIEKGSNPITAPILWTKTLSGWDLALSCH
jgi:hypothetical protein